MFAPKTNTQTSSPKNNLFGASTNGFIQPKLNVGQPGDKYEVEADKAADQIVAKGKDNASSFIAPAPQIQKQSEEDVQKQEADQEIQQKPVVEPITPGVQLKTDPMLQQSVEEEVQTNEGEEEVQQQKEDDVQAKSEKELTQAKESDMQPQLSPVVQKQAEEDIQEKEDEEVQEKEQEESLQKQSTAGDDGGSNIEQQLSDSKGGGSALDSGTQSEMESGFGADFSGVRVHNDSNAVQMNQELGSQAFTNGNDIYFNEGKYNPESDSGKHLLAHELTHTVQQGASPSAQPKTIQKEEDAVADTAAGTGTNPEDIIQKFYLPKVKARHLSLYQTWASGGKLKRHAGYSRGHPKQVRIWKNALHGQMQNLDKVNLDADFRGTKIIEDPAGKKLRGRKNSLLKKLTIPYWDKQGNVLANTLEVDHIVELQVGGWGGSDKSANELANMELLDKSSNATAGAKTKSNISRIVRTYLEAKGEPHSQADADTYMASNTIEFKHVEIGQDPYDGATPQNKYWTREEIIQGLHLEHLKDMGNIEEAGSPTEFALFTPDDGFPIQTFPHDEGVNSFDISPEDHRSKAVAGLTISHISLTSGYESKAKDEPIGSFTATWDLPPEFEAPDGSFNVSLSKSEDQYAGKVGAIPPFGAEFDHMSPVDFSADYGVNEDGLFAEGTLTPSLPFLQGTSLDVGLRGTEVYFNAEYSPSELNLPIPGVTVDASTLWVGYSSVNGFGVGGNIEFTLSKIGTGTLEGGFTQGEGLFMRGNINFDEKLFGGSKASARMAYENSLWSIGGTLEIPPNKVRGIKTATIEADYSEANGLIGSGEAELSIPGIDQGSMAVEYNDQGFAIAGDFNLSPDIPGIRSGQVAARVAKPEGQDDYDVMVSGTAQPDIPEIDSELSVTYENGALTIEGSAQYSRGMLSGEIMVGATNKAIGDDGQPLGEPDDTMRVYGGGSLTLQLTPWLAATAGVRFLPNGEMEVTARLDAPRYDVFPRQEVNKNLFTVPTIEIPLFAIPLGPKSIGLVAQIGGGLDFTAGFGPGHIRNVYAEITYNPDREEETTVRGHGEFAIPADAGLTLRGDLSIGASVAIASITGGIELAGTLGLAGEALASVDLGWTPQTGLEINAEGSILVSPKFTFDINAFIRGTLGIGWLSVSETWRKNLVSYEWGPGIEFGIRFPVNYKEGEPFSMSLDDIEIGYPELDIPDMASDIASDVKDEIF